VEPQPAQMTKDTIFDLSSLTKPLATGVAMMLLVRDGLVSLDDRVPHYLPEFAAHGKGEVTLRHLLSHSSGLPAWRPYYRHLRRIEEAGEHGHFLGSAAAKGYVYSAVERERPEAPPGCVVTYSDLGFIALGAIIESLTGRSLDRFCTENIFQPLALSRTGFRPLSFPFEDGVRLAAGPVAATERCPWRGKILCGEVHDDNAWAMGGVAGHAGVFAPVRDVDALLCRLRSCFEGRDDFIPQWIVRLFWNADPPVVGSTRALAWDRPAACGSMAGSCFSRRTVGHLGFTGTSVWVDLEKQRHVILLSNRVHPDRGNDAIRTFRPTIHDLINRELDG